MKKQCFWLILLLLGSQAYADDIQADRAKIDAQLGLVDTVTHATSYYGDYEYHYELTQIGLDQLGEGLP